MKKIVVGFNIVLYAIAIFIVWVLIDHPILEWVILLGGMGGA